MGVVVRREGGITPPPGVCAPPAAIFFIEPLHKFFACFFWVYTRLLIVYTLLLYPVYTYIRDVVMEYIR